MVPGVRHPLDSSYFKRIAAIEFAVKFDDGIGGGPAADIVLVGVSRTSKTPLSMYLGNMGYKTANVPLVKGIEPPKELFELDPAKIVGLTIDAGRLAEIRQARVRQMRANPKAYAELLEIYEELEHAEKIHRRLGCPVLDITEQSIEETATRVVKLVEDRKRLRLESCEAADPALALGALVVPARRRDVPLLRPPHPDLDRAARAGMDRRIPGAAPQALARLRALWLPVAQAALAATLAWWLAHEVIGHRNAFFAPIAALIALGVGVSNRPRRVIELTLGVAVGIGVGDVLIWGIGTGTWQLGLIVFLAMAIAVLIGGGPLFVSQAGSSAVLVATLVGAHNASRFVDALVGGAIGLAVLVVVPLNPLRGARQAGSAVFTELAATLDDIAAALEARDIAAVREALARARAAEGLVTRWRELSPSAGRPPGSRPSSGTTAAGSTSTRLRSRTSTSRSTTRACSPGRQPGRSSSIRTCLPRCRRRCGSWRRRSVCRAGAGEAGQLAAIDTAVEAAALATQALEVDPALAAAHLVGQIRGIAADLLRALGLERSDAVERIRAAR